MKRTPLIAGLVLTLLSINIFPAAQLSLSANAQELVAQGLEKYGPSKSAELPF